MPPRKLTPDAQAEIVGAHARFTPPQDIIATIKAKYGVDVTPQDVARYDPTTAASVLRGLAQKWKDLFERVRADYLREVSRVDIANKVVRLQKLSRQIRALENEPRTPVKLIADLIELADKIAGDHHTNRREITGKDGAPLQAPVVINLSALTLAEVERLEAVALAAQAQGRTTIEIPFTPVESTS